MLARIRRCFCYWWESISSSKEVFDKITWVLTIIAWLVVLLQELEVFPSTSWQVFSEPGLARLTWILALLLTARAIFWLPFCRHEKLIAELQAVKDGASPLEIITETRTYNSNDWKKAVEILVKNPNLAKGAENVSVRLLKIEPPLVHRGNRGNDGITTENSGVLPVICSSEYAAANSINAGQTARFEILSVAAGSLKPFGQGNKSQIIAAFPPGGNSGGDFMYCLPPLGTEEFKEYNLTIEVTAKDRARTEARFKLTLSVDVEEVSFTLNKIQSKNEGVSKPVFPVR